MEQMHLLLLVQVMVIQIFFLVVAEAVPNLIQHIQYQEHPQVDLVVEVLVEEQQSLMVVDLEVVEVMVQ